LSGVNWSPVRNGGELWRLWRCRHLHTHRAKLTVPYALRDVARPSLPSRKRTRERLALLKRKARPRVRTTTAPVRFDFVRCPSEGCGDTRIKLNGRLAG
jgi:hypothetical protein